MPSLYGTWLELLSTMMTEYQLMEYLKCYTHLIGIAVDQINHAKQQGFV